jgi:hypothetical protein
MSLHYLGPKVEWYGRTYLIDHFSDDVMGLGVFGSRIVIRRRAKPYQTLEYDCMTKYTETTVGIPRTRYPDVTIIMNSAEINVGRFKVRNCRLFYVGRYSVGP